MLKSILETFLSTICYYTGVVWLYNRSGLRRRTIPIIGYHEIQGSSAEDVGLSEFSVTLKNFENQIIWLKRHFNIVSVSVLAKHIQGQVKLPGIPMSITFDGGYKGNYRFAYPILKKYNIPAAIYIMVDCIDGRIPWERRLLYMIYMTQKSEMHFSHRGKSYNYPLTSYIQRKMAKKIIQNYMVPLENTERETLMAAISENLNVDLSNRVQQIFLSWQEILEMQSESSLIEIGSHTLTHPRLTDIPIKQAEREIRESKTRIEDVMNVKITSFCYPDGYYSESIKKIVQNCGYSSALAVSTEGVPSDLNKCGDDVYELRRIGMIDRSYIPLLAIEMSGLMRILKKMGKFILQKS